MNSANIDHQRAVAMELVALTMIADGLLATRELEALDRHGIAALLGLPREALMRTVAAHCRNMLERPAMADPVRLIDIERFEALLDRITDQSLRRLVCRAMLVLAKADGAISPPEQTLLRTALTRWELSLERIRD